MIQECVGDTNQDGDLAQKERHTTSLSEAFLEQSSRIQGLKNKEVALEKQKLKQVKLFLDKCSNESYFDHTASNISAIPTHLDGSQGPVQSGTKISKKTWQLPAPYNRVMIAKTCEMQAMPPCAGFMKGQQRTGS